MRRVLVPIACVWGLVFVIAYVAFARQPENQGPAWWFVGLVAAGVLAAAASVWWRRGRLALLIIATAAFGLGVLAGLLSVGLLLLPAAGLTLMAALPESTG